MPESPDILKGLDPSDAKLLMCALILGGAENEIKTSFFHPTRISEFEGVEEALREAYDAMTRSCQETQTATFRITALGRPLTLAAQNEA